jgi:hypothetical protein
MEQVTNNVVLSEQEQKYIKDWSGAGFFAPWLFLFVNKQNKLAWKILLLFILSNFLQLIPYLGITIPGISLSMLGNLSLLDLLYFGLAIWIAIKGREKAWDSGKFTSFETFKAKQSTAVKFTWIFIVIYLIVCIALYANLVSQYMKNPQILNNRVYEQALNDMKSNSSNVNEVEFKNGYNLGLTEGGKANPILNSSITSQSDSYKKGYQYGFIMSCMDNGNQVSCTMKLLSSGAM